MPDPKRLKVGDKIRIVGIPEADVWAYESGSDHLSDTIHVLRWMVGKTFVIDRVDEFHPWLDLQVPTDDGEVAEHTIAIMDGDFTSWEYCIDSA